MSERTPEMERKLQLAKMNRALTKALKHAKTALKLSQEVNGTVSAWTEIGASIRKLDKAKDSVLPLDLTDAQIARYFAVKSYVATTYYLLATRDKCQMVPVASAEKKARKAWERMVEPDPRNKRGLEDYKLAVDFGAPYWKEA